MITWVVVNSSVKIVVFLEHYLQKKKIDRFVKVERNFRFKMYDYRRYHAKLMLFLYITINPSQY